MRIQQLTLKEYRKSLSDSFFESAYVKLQLNEELNNSEIKNLLKNAILFSNLDDIDLQKL